MVEPKHVFIEGLTTDGKAFRPSDWAERLAGALSPFRPEGSSGGAASFIGYSPYCVPRYLRGVKGVMVDARLRDLELMAWDFVMSPLTVIFALFAFGHLFGFVGVLIALPASALIAVATARLRASYTQSSLYTG